MAAHLRARIRDGIVASLAGLPLFGARVFANRVYPLARESLPGVTVAFEAETVTGQSFGPPAVLTRLARYVVRVVAEDNADLEGVLGEGCRQIEVALATPAGLAGIAKAINLIATDYTTDGSTQKPVGYAAMTYEVLYMAAENAPDVAL